MPKIPKSANKAKACLYPSEDAQLVGCARVALERRLAYGILAREGMRASELSSLRWRDLDLKHGRVRLDENKTDDPRAWALSPDVVRVLAWWKMTTQGEARDLVLGLDLDQGSHWLRGRECDPKTRHAERIGDLMLADVDRPELFERTASRQPLRLHDLRATFVTVSLANGKTEQWVTDRTGHKSSQMVSLVERREEARGA
jgi:integrase